ncbi:MAG: MFS transporter [Lachnospiraceae bacterium]|nr:MFS transporter [Lachnospiraceae bacterium]
MLNKNFLLIMIGQIISLFGNAILRFALPLYLLGKTDSVMIFGLVSACSFVPMILLYPIGGLIADRINKRNIMVILDFFTAGITLLFTIALGKIDLTILILVMLILLYGIQGTYQPAVQASVPLLMSRDDLVKGNAAINLISSLASLAGPIAGGAIYGFFGLYPILYVSILCFTLSAVMELFIKIPYEKRMPSAGIFQTALLDLKESIKFMRKERPVIWKISLIAATVNLFFSSLINIALPVIITLLLGFSETTGNRLFGYAQAVLAAGSLTGGLLAGILSRKQKAYYQYLLLILTSVTLLPIAAGLFFPMPGVTVYLIIIICCFVTVTISSLFSIQMLSYLQLLTPHHMLGKVTSCTMCICMCSQPIGQAIYGILVEILKERIYLLFITAFAVTALTALGSRKIFKEVDTLLS